MGHYYDANGRACHTVIGKNCKERGTTLKDARERGLFKSVTTIMNVLDKPALTAWKVREALASAWDEWQRGDLFSDIDDFMYKTQAETERRMKEKPDLGTAIHAAIEAFMNGQAFPVEYEEYVYAAKKALLTLGIPLNAWRSEHAYCWPRLGYAGTIDLHCDYMGRRIVLDFKSKGFAREKRGSVQTAKDVTYPEHVMQLAAYGRGLFESQPHEAYNVMLSTEEKGLWLMRSWQPDEIGWGWDTFSKARDLCFAMDKYDPRPAF